MKSQTIGANPPNSLKTSANKNRLRLTVFCYLLYYMDVPAKSGTGISLLIIFQGVIMPVCAGFYCGELAHLNYGGLSGSTTVRRDLGSGKANPAQFATQN
ncbi:TPA: hypothetical protein ACX6PO_002285 [Photobacterium damselae]